MSSLRLTTQLKQQMVLTPQLRQRIEMLQMTSLELAELIQNELVSNPILEEVPSSDELNEIAEKILDQNANGQEDFDQASRAGENDLRSESSLDSYESYDDFSPENPTENGHKEDYDGDSDFDGGEGQNESSDAFDEIDYGKEFQEYLDPGYKTQEIEYKEDAPSFEQFLSKSENLTEHLEWQVNLQSITDELKDTAIGVIGNLDSDGRLNATNEEIAELCGVTEETAEKARQIVMRLEPVG